jgi:tetratricopeptide (TPR) repeat protein
LNSSLVRNGRDVNSLYNRGYLYGTVGCTKAAIIDLSKAIDVDPMSAKLFCERGICYLDMGEYAKAQVDLNMAIHLNPASGDARLARGRLYLQLNRPDKALVDLLAAKEPQMEFAPALPGELPSNFYRAPDYYLGTCYEMLGSYDLALQSFREAAKDVTGADNGYIHRYADRPIDAVERVNKLQSG